MMALKPRSLVLIALMTAGPALRPAIGAGHIEEVTYPASEKPGELVYGVTYRVWIPDDVPRLRGLIVHQHGCGKGACQGGMTAADDLHWQALARKWGCALMGPSYQQEDGQNCRLWCDPRNGSRARFLQALDDLAKTSGHPELATVPWCLWGHSGGGFWASLMQLSDPDRIVAVWLRSGSAMGAWEKGEIARPTIPDAAYRIPVVCNPGVQERDDKRFNGAWTGTLDLFHAYRKNGAPIAFAPDPRTSHQCGDSRYLAIPFFDACLEARLPDPGSAVQALKPVAIERGWLAPCLGDKAAPAADYRGAVEEAVWLPNEQVARAWTEYVKTGAVGDTTPPSAPGRVRVAATGDGSLTLTWDAAADFESGIAGFLIQRNGREIGRLPAETRGNPRRFGRPLFQAMSYHDTPEAPLPAMRFVDSSAKTEDKPKYQVITINSVGLQSEPSATAEAP